MEDIYTLYAKATLTKEKFLHGIRTVIDAMIQAFPPELQQLYTPELLDRIMVLYAERYPDYLKSHTEVARQIYTEDQVVTLLDLQTRYPWMDERTKEFNQLSIQVNQQRTQEMIGEIGAISEAYFEEMEEEAEAMADGKD